MKDLNIINKILTIVFFGIALYLCNNDILFYLISIILITCLFNTRSFTMGILVVLVITAKIFNINVDNIDRLYYFILMVSMVSLVLSSLTILQKQYIFDNTLYKWRDMRLTRKYIYNCYHDEYFDKNVNNIKGKYSINNYKHLLNNAELKTNRDLSEVYVLHRIRFYQLYNKKTTFFPDRWKKLDTMYLVVMVLLLLIILFFK